MDKIAEYLADWPQAAAPSDAYGRDDLGADAAAQVDPAETDHLDSDYDVQARSDGRADENDYSHAEGEPDAVAGAGSASASEELEEFARGDPT